MGSYETSQPIAGSLWLPSTTIYLFRRTLICSFDRCIRTDRGLVLCCQVNHTRFCAGGDCDVFPSSWRIPLKACPGLGTPAAPSDLALTVTQMLPSARLTASASATTNISELNSTRPTFSLSTLLSTSVARREARLATSLPAKALAGLDLHQLDSFREVSSAHFDSSSPKLSLAQ